MASRVAAEEVDEVMLASEYDVRTVFDLCTVVSMRMPNGYILVEASACVDPADYSEEVGQSICCESLRDRVWALLGYERKLQEQAEMEALK